MVTTCYFPAIKWFCDHVAYVFFLPFTPIRVSGTENTTFQASNMLILNLLMKINNMYHQKVNIELNYGTKEYILIIIKYQT